MKRPVCGRQDRVRTTQIVHATALHPRLGHVSAGAHEGWELERGDWRANPGLRLLLAVRRQPEGIGGEEIHNREYLWRKAGLP